MLIIIELTVPWEERCNEAHERKLSKYEDLLAEWRKQGWKTWNFNVEVGCRGFPAQTVWRMFSALGITRKNRRTAVQKISQTAERASCWVWMKRNSSRETGGIQERLEKGYEGLAAPYAVPVKGHLNKLQKILVKYTPRVFRVGGRMKDPTGRIIWKQHGSSNRH